MVSFNHRVLLQHGNLRSAKIFKSVASGKFGDSLLSGYLQNLSSFSRLGASEVVMDYFCMTLQTMGEHWRRFCFLTQGFPWTLFQLVDLDSDEAFLDMYMKLQGQLATCEACVDLEFSSVFLTFIPKGSQLQDGDVHEKIRKLRAFLRDVCQVGPLSSDPVECQHGFSQRLVARWRGSRPTDAVAQERIFWARVTSMYSKFKDWVWDRYMDKGFRSRLCQFGRRSSNQYSGEKPCDKQSGKKKFTLETMERIIAFGQNLPGARRLSGILAIDSQTVMSRVES